MLPLALSSFGKARKLIFSDRVSFFLAAIPVFIGICVYSVFGKIFYSNVMNFGQTYIEKVTNNGDVGGIIYHLVSAILAIVLFFIVNWTFVIVVTIIASPFNSILSERIEKTLLGEELPSFNESFKLVASGFVSSLANEMKKLGLIVTLSIVSLIATAIPFLTPISFAITITLLIIEYLDYSWSRHNLLVKDCKNDLRKNIFKYAFGGLIFFLLITIPIINLVVPSLATVYFTILWIGNNELSDKASE